MRDRPVLDSDRLHLTPSSLEDLERVEALWTHPDVRRFLFDDRVISREEARGFLERSEESFRASGYGLWLATIKPGEGLSGFSGLLPSGGSDPNLIFGIHPDFWGRGYASEAASAVLRYAFEVLELPRVRADVDEPNGASVRVLERLRMKRARRAIVQGRPLLYYELLR